jgi:hypothetical protein
MNTFEHLLTTTTQQHNNTTTQQHNNTTHAFVHLFHHVLCDWLHVQRSDESCAHNAVHGPVVVTLFLHQFFGVVATTHLQQLAHLQSEAAFSPLLGQQRRRRQQSRTPRKLGQLPGQLGFQFPFVLGGIHNLWHRQ